MATTLKFGSGLWATKEDSVLAYNDENGNYKPLPFEFERDTNATVVNKSGLIETVGNNIPRIDFQGNNKGALLLEPERTNEINYSEDFSNSDWTKVNVTITSNNSTSPDGSLNADLIVSNNADSYLSNSLVVSDPSVFSVFVKYVDQQFIQLYSGLSANYYANFDIKNNILGTKGAFTSEAKIENYGNGWYRLSAVFSQVTPTGGSSVRLGFAKTIDSVWGSLNTSSGSSVLLWGCQLEEASYPTSYIPTQGGTVTRAADVCEQTTPDGVIGQTEGTIFLDSKMALKSISNYQLFSINNGGSSDRIRIITATDNRLRFIYQLDGGNFTYSFYNPTDYSDLTSLKIAFTYKSGDIKIYINGVLVDSSTDTFTIAEKLTDIDIASSAGGFNQMSFSEVKIYDQALTDQELQALTQV